MLVSWFLLLAFFLTLVSSTAVPSNQAAAAAKNKVNTNKRPRRPDRPRKQMDFSESSKEQLLIRKVLGNYNKEIMPERPVVVSLELLLIKVKSTIEKEGIFECVVALFIEWQDKRLTWDPTEFNDTSVLAFDPHQVWLPDIAVCLK